jgi:hypothetical protein
MADKSTVTVGPWPKGIDNRAPDYAVPEDALRNAVDVDLLRDGRVRRRDGYQRLIDLPGVHSLWSCPQGVFFVWNSSLYKFLADNDITPLLSDVVGKPIAYEYVDGVIYFSDGIIVKKILNGDTIVDWGIKTPASAPLLSTTTGTLPAASYVGAVSFVNSFGEESGLSSLAYLTTFATGGVLFSQFPSPANSAVVSTRLYLSTPGGTTLYHVADVAVNTTNYAITALNDVGKEADLTRIIAPPGCNIIRHKSARMYCAAGDVVWYTEPFALGRVNAGTNFWQFAAPVSVLEPVEAGLFIVADKSYFYRFTDPAEAKVEILFDYGAVPNTSVVLPHGKGIMWQSERGAIMADENGKAENVQEAKVALGGAPSGAALLREADGLQQYVAVLSDAEPTSLVATSFFEAEVIRTGA